MNQGPAFNRGLNSSPGEKTLPTQVGKNKSGGNTNQRGEKEKGVRPISHEFTRMNTPGKRKKIEAIQKEKRRARGGKNRLDPGY